MGKHNEYRYSKESTTIQILKLPIYGTLTNQVTEVKEKMEAAAAAAAHHKRPAAAGLPMIKKYEVNKLREGAIDSQVALERKSLKILHILVYK